MAEALFETNYLGTKTTVFSTHVSYKVFFIEKSIPIHRISSIELGVPLHAQVVIETSGGEKHKIPVKLGDKEKLRDAIYSAMKT